MLQVGGGSLGSLLAAKLASTGQVEVSLLTQWQDHADAINEKGLEIRSGTATPSPQVNTALPPATIAGASAVFSQRQPA